MPSQALIAWEDDRASSLDELVTAHAAVGGTGPGRRYATEQINHAYLLALASQFQGFCRDLHSEATDFVANATQPPGLQTLVSAALTQGRQLDRGNAHSGSIGADFGRFDLEVWDDVLALHAFNTGRKRNLDQLNTWRNALAHQDFRFNAQQQALIAGTTPRLRFVRRWRSACNHLAVALDQVLADHLEAIVGTRPW